MTDATMNAENDKHVAARRTHRASIGLESALSWVGQGGKADVRLDENWTGGSVHIGPEAESGSHGEAAVQGGSGVKWQAF